MKTRKEVFAALLLSVAAGSAHSASCTPTSGCSVTLDDGTIADFCSIFKPGGYLETKAKSTYKYNGQSGVACDKQFPDMAICQYIFGGTSGLGLGKYTPGNLGCSVVSVAEGAYVFNIQYLNGEADRSAKVTVHYQGGGEKFESFTLASSEDLSFDLYVSGSSSGGGGVGVDPGVVGILLIIMFVAAVTTYVVVGVLVNKYRKGAEGVEIFPNYHFWKDFPFLLKDGVVFTFTAWPCCKHVGFTKNYTRI